MSKPKWCTFNIDLGRHQKLPEERKWVILQIVRPEALKTRVAVAPDPFVVGYLRYAAGDKNCPYFIIPGIGGVVYKWCDCIPIDFDTSWLYS